MTATNNVTPGPAQTPNWTVGADLRVGDSGSGQLDLTNGGKVSNNFGYVGYAAGSVGEVNVSGVDGGGAVSTWTSSKSMHVGENGSGTLNITGGGKVNGGTGGNYAYIGKGATGVGAVTVSGVAANGARSSLITLDRLYIGSAGRGTLNILDGGLTSAEYTMIIGDLANSSGLVEVDGVNATTGDRSSLKVVHNLLWVGGDGLGTLNVRGGGQVDVEAAILLGGGATSQGFIVVDGVDQATGARSTITTQEMDIGFVNRGQMDVLNGGLVTTTSDMWVGELAGAVGVLTVDGRAPGSTVRSTVAVGGDFYVGQTGDGTLGIKNGGLVSVDGVSYVGRDAHSLGRVTVSGQDSDGNASTWANAGDLRIGDQGVGALTIEGGGAVSTDGISYIAYDIGSQGTAIVSGDNGHGAASTWTSTIDLVVGQFGAGALTIQDGGLVNNVTSYIGASPGSTGTATVSGHASNGVASTWANTDDVLVGDEGTGVLNIQDGGAVTATDAVRIGNRTDSTGTVTVSSNTSDVSILTADYINVGGDGDGALTIGKGGKVSAGSDVYIADDGASHGALHLNGDADGHGVLETGSVIRGNGAATLDLNGGVLRATRDEYYFLNGFNALTVGSQGAWFDTNRHDIRVAADFSGTSTFAKLGLGKLTLSGDSAAFTGATTVAAGTLLVGDTGDVASLGGSVDVQANATLGGVGTIGGNVSVADGGVLSPGGSGAPGTLKINGGLSLSNTSALNYRLGQAGVAGGALNDLVVVHGDLTLDGTLNVTSSGGAFGPGLYRLIDYTGALIDHGLTLGSMPAGADTVVQTSIANQVNLVNTAGLDLRFWDGDKGSKFNSMVDGGDGVWHGGGDNWTEEAGKINAAYEKGAFVVFAGSLGKVSVDNSGGAVTVSGMQFATDGYVVTDGTIDLDAADAIVRVGDNTEKGAAFKAKIASKLTGPGRLDKTDFGTLILTGANSYAGGTTISSGVLQLGDGGTSGSIQGDVAVAGVLAFNRSNVANFGGAISGGGVVQQIGSGTTVLTGNSSAFTGRTQIRAGTLEVDGVLGGPAEVLSGARLTGEGRIGSTDNRGVIAPGREGLGTLTVAGDYTGLGGDLEIETQLEGDSSPTDRLMVTGATSGVTLVTVTNLDGLGARTEKGIQVVRVGGASSGQFALANGDYVIDGQPVIVAGAYGYVLRKDETDGDWYLRSSLRDLDINAEAGPIYQPGVPVYEAYANTLLSLSEASTLRRRTGDRQYGATDTDRAGVWGRIEGETSHLESSASTSGARQDIDSWKTEFGVDRLLFDAEDGARLIGGLTANLGGANTRLSSIHGGGEIDTKAYGVGATLTWYGQQGVYVDVQTRAAWFDSDLRSNIAGRLADGLDGHGYGLSFETGQSFPIREDLSITPQAQLSYASTGFKAFDDLFGAHVDDGNSEGLRGRIGLALDQKRNWRDAAGHARQLSLYGLANIKHEFLDGTPVLVSGTPLDGRQGRTWGGLGGGGNYSWGDGRYAVHGEVAAETGLSNFGDNYVITATAGFRVRF